MKKILIILALFNFSLLFCAAKKESSIPFEDFPDTLEKFGPADLRYNKEKVAKLNELKSVPDFSNFPFGLPEMVLSYNIAKHKEWYEGGIKLFKMLRDLKNPIAEKEKEEIIQLIEFGIDVNARGLNNNTPLMVAIENFWEHNDVSLIKLLIDNGADVNIKNSHGDTALHFVADLKTRNDDRLCQIAKLLIKKKAEVNLKNKSNETSLMKASKNGDILLVDLLLKNGAEITSILIDPYLGIYRTDLSLAAAQGHLGIVKLLLYKSDSKLIRHALKIVKSKLKMNPGKITIYQPIIELFEQQIAPLSLVLPESSSSSSSSVITPN